LVDCVAKDAVDNGKKNSPEELAALVLKWVENLLRLIWILFLFVLGGGLVLIGIGIILGQCVNWLNEQ
jgi:hypothetical protein